MNPVWLDITRLVERTCAGTLTGIDRVELAYAQTLPRLTRSVRFVIFIPWLHRIAVLPDRQARAFNDRLAAAWCEGHPRHARAAAIQLLAWAVLTGWLVRILTSGRPICWSPTGTWSDRRHSLPRWTRRMRGLSR